MMTKMLPDIADYYSGERAQVAEAAWLCGEQYGRNAAIISELLHNFGLRNIIEFGCWSGLTATRLPEGISYFGIDKSPTFVDWAIHRNTAARRFACRDIRDVTAQWLTSQGCELPVDLVASFCFLKHVGLHEWDETVCTMLSFGRRSVLEVQLAPSDCDDGTDFHHVFVDPARLLRALARASHRLVDDRLLFHGSSSTGLPIEVRAIVTEYAPKPQNEAPAAQMPSDDLHVKTADETLPKTEIGTEGPLGQAGLVPWRDFLIREDNLAQDLFIIGEVFDGDTYRVGLLADSEDPNQVVVDVGAHIGAFARLWHRKNPRAKIICVEACPENLPALIANVGDFATVIQAACTYEHGRLAILNAVRPHCESTGGSVVVPWEALDDPAHPLRQQDYHYWNDRRDLAQVTLEEIMRSTGVDHIDLLKLDCEGSEFSILRHTTSLERIRLIVGEFHGRDRWQQLLVDRFSDWDYGDMSGSAGYGGVFHLANRKWRLADEALEGFLQELRACFLPQDLCHWSEWRPYYAALFRLARELAPHSICEIGVRAGYSALAFLSASPGATVLGIDADMDDASKGYCNHAKQILADRDFRLVVANSHDLTELPPADLVYVDGEHLRATCLRDLVLASRASNRILVDDHGQSGEVRAACEVFLASYEGYATRLVPYDDNAMLLMERAAALEPQTLSPPTLTTAVRIQRVLREPPHLRVAVPGGIGDSLWALTKLPAMLRDYGIQRARVWLCGGPPHRAKEFIERFGFVESAEYCDWSCVEDRLSTPDGAYAWAPSQPNWHDSFDWMLQANQHLERGGRLETWLREFETDFTIGDQFRFTGGEVRHARDLESTLGPYCVFYLGPEAGNTYFGHNRGPLWHPTDWAALAAHCRSLGLKIVVVGADYDRSYFETYVLPVGFGDCFDAIGRWQIGQTFAVVQRARFVISYQSGIGIFCPYLGVPAASFWRPYGDSIHASTFISFDERMAEAWVPPGYTEYLPLIYTRCSPETIIERVVSAGWDKR